LERLADTTAVDTAAGGRLTLALLRRGVRAIPGGNWYVNAAHTPMPSSTRRSIFFEDPLTEL
jgi:hypothetical protein